MTDKVVVEEVLIETVTIAPDEVEVLETGFADIIEVGAKGDVGPEGPQGPIGPVGPPGGGNWAYVHDQMVPANPWVINHMLAGYPNITIIDSTGREVVGDIEYVDNNTIVASFNGGFAGKAYLS